MIQTEEKPMTARELQLTHVIEQQNEIMERLYSDNKKITEPEITIQSIRTAIQQAYHDAARAECTGDQILHMVWGFEYLLQRLGVE